MGIQTNFYKFSTISPKHAIHIFPIWCPCHFFNKGQKHIFYDQYPKHVFYTVSIKRLKQKYVFPIFPYRNPNNFLYISIWSPKYVFHIFSIWSLKLNMFCMYFPYGVSYTFHINIVSCFLQCCINASKKNLNFLTQHLDKCNYKIIDINGKMVVVLLFFIICDIKG